MAAVLAYLAATIIAVWGIAHVIPTRQVVSGFGAIGPDNRRILVQEWWAEALAMWALAGVIVAVTATGIGTASSSWAERVVVVALLGLAVLTAMTGARTAVVWFRVCPAVLVTSAGLLLAGTLV